MNAALASGSMDVVGVGRPFCVDPKSGTSLTDGAARVPAMERRLRIGPGLLGPASPWAMVRALNGWGQQGWFCLQILRMADGHDPNLKLGVFRAFQDYQKNEAATAKAMAR
jgi:hypothetical protein